MAQALGVAMYVFGFREGSQCSPSLIEVEPGTALRFTNDGRKPHSKPPAELRRSIAGPTEVRLHRPTPLDRDPTVVATEAGGSAATDADGELLLSGAQVPGWPMGAEGGKHRAGNAVVGRDGRIRAAATQTCIALPIDRAR